jgi:DNA-binding CsgD family transcriptional regulator
VTVIQLGLSVRDSQILELLHAGAPMNRIVAIGAHRNSWTVQQVGIVVARWYRPEDSTGRKPGPKPRPRPTPPAKVTPLPVARAGTVTPAPTAAGWVPPPPAQPHQAILTGRQALVLQQLLTGGSNAHIAARLSIAEDTVKSHMRAVLNALGVTDRTAAAVAVLTGQVHVKVGEGQRARARERGAS